MMTPSILVGVAAKGIVMMNLRRVLFSSSLVLSVVCCLPAFVIAQNSVTILSGAELNQVVPPGFYFQGLSAPTQMRNSTAARFGTKRFVIAGLVPARAMRPHHILEAHRGRDDNVFGQSSR